MDKEELKNGTQMLKFFSETFPHFDNVKTIK